MRFDYDVLTVRVDANSDVGALPQKYIAGGHTGIFITVDRGFKLDNLQFLSNFPNLRYVEVVGSVKDDSAAFRLPQLLELTLVTRCRAPIPNLEGAKLQSVGIDGPLDRERPGLAELAALKDLSNLSLWRWHGGDFRFLGKPPTLRRLYVEGSRQVTTLDGLDLCPALQDVELMDMRVASLAPLSAARELRRLLVIGSHTMPEDVYLDLADLSRLTNLEELRITYGGHVRSLQALRALPKLKDLRLRGTQVADDELGMLANLATHMTVVGPKD